MTNTSLLIRTLWYGVFPLWVLAGMADYLYHRRTDIEHTSGVKESRLHLAQALQLAPALLVALFLRVNALTLTVIALCVLVHTATAYWDVRFTTGKRPIRPGEQLVHGVLLLLPIFATTLAALAYWDDLTGVGAWRLEVQPMQPTHLALILSSVVVLNFLPLLEEFWRTRAVALRGGAE